MMCVQPLMQSALVTVRRVEHPPGTLVLDTVEESEWSHAICFVEAGGFQLGAGSNEWLLREGDLFVARPGALYRYTHLSDVAPDVCVVASLARRFDDDCDRELRFPHVVPRRTNRIAYLQFRLAAIAQAGDTLAAECWVADAMAALREASGDRERPFRMTQVRWYAERVEAARQTLSTDFSEEHSLAALATTAGMSPFQFARIFRQLVGVPPHRYLLEVRLDHARQLLLDHVSVTDACYDTGFSSLSHFIRMFARRFGCTPSTVRAAAQSRTR